MTPRDWVAAGGAFLFGGVGLAVWQGATGESAGVLTLLGAGPLVMGIAALYELVKGDAVGEVERCHNCDGATEVEDGVCSACFESMPMGVWITPGRWDPAQRESQAALYELTGGR